MGKTIPHIPIIGIWGGMYFLDNVYYVGTIRLLWRCCQQIFGRVYGRASEEHAMAFKFTLKELRSYKAGRGKAEIIGMTAISKDNLPDERLFSITEAERLRKLIEYLGSLEGKDP